MTSLNRQLKRQWLTNDQPIRSVSPHGSRAQIYFTWLLLGSKILITNLSFVTYCLIYRFGGFYESLICYKGNLLLTHLAAFSSFSCFPIYRFWQFFYNIHKFYFKQIFIRYSLPISLRVLYAEKVYHIMSFNYYHNRHLLYCHVHHYDRWI